MPHDAFMRSRLSFGMNSHTTVWRYVSGFDKAWTRHGQGVDKIWTRYGQGMDSHAIVWRYGQGMDKVWTVMLHTPAHGPAVPPRFRECPPEYLVPR